MAYFNRRSSQRLFFKIIIGCIVFTALLISYLFLVGYTAFGTMPSNEKLVQLSQSPQWSGEKFQNKQKIWADSKQAWQEFLFGDGSPNFIPHTTIPVVIPTPQSLKYPENKDIRVTWFGHSSTLVQLEGVNILIDPLWSNRSSPISWLGPEAWFPSPISLNELPFIDAVVISHDHYDHLDYGTVVSLPKETKFIVPLGVGSHLQSWGITSNRIVELDWWESIVLNEIQVTATPARHKSGRFIGQSGKTLWAGYAISSNTQKLWYSGDSGFHQDLERIGHDLGPFDVTLIDSGQYDTNWPDTHFGPELAVEAHKLVQGKSMIPVHWGLLKEANHGWTEPVERVLTAAKCQNIRVLVPRPGESIYPKSYKSEKWWPPIAWRTSLERPVIATKNGLENERVDNPTEWCES